MNRKLISSCFALCFTGLLGLVLLASGQRGRGAGHTPLQAALATPSAQAAQVKVNETYGKLPLSFEANRGQTDPEVKFLARGQGYNLLLKPTEAMLTLRKSEGKQRASSSTTLRMKLAGANSVPQMSGVEALPSHSNYFIGSDPQTWRADVPHYARVQYDEVYPGIDLVYYGQQRQLEYDFIVAPGADPRRIRLAFTGAKQMRIEADGELVLDTGGGEVRQHKPVIYQAVNGERKPIAGRYQMHGSREVGFEIGAYDATQPLVIDPVLVYSTYYGGTAGDAFADIAVDREGNVYAIGITNSPNLTTANAAQRSLSGGTCNYTIFGQSATAPCGDAFVTKINAAGTAIVYTTYLGGTGTELGPLTGPGFTITYDGSLAVDGTGNVYVAGLTAAPDFPVVNPLQRSLAGPNDAFVAKLNPAGNALVYSTYLGGSLQDLAEDIAVDATGNVYVTGLTTSTNFPTRDPLQAANGGAADVFIAKLNPAGSELVYSTYLGGNGADVAKSLAVDATGNVTFCGITLSTNFPTRNPLQAARGGGAGDGFVAKLNAAGSALVYSTWLGGAGTEEPHMVALDSAGNAYVTGGTNSLNFPVRNALQPAYGGIMDAFVTKISADGSTLVYSTYLGGNSFDFGLGLAVDATGQAYVTGFTISTNFPLVNPVQATNSGAGPLGTGDAFVAKLNAAGTTLVYSTYLGGSNDEFGRSVAVDAEGNAYIAGSSNSTNFPTRNPLQAANAAPADGVLFKLGPDNRSTVAASVSAASFAGGSLANSSVVALFGADLASTTLGATATPLPTALAGTTVSLRDSSGTELPASLFFVSPNQINFQIPPSAFNGPATVIVRRNNASVAVGTTQIVPVAPGIFGFNGTGQGVPAGVVLRVRTGNVQSTEALAQLNAQNQYVAIPVDLGAETDQVFLVLFGTGIRFRSSLLAMAATIGGVDAPVTAGVPAPGLIGTDQINLRVPRSLIGRGEVEVMLTLDGQTANTTRVNIR